MVRPQYDFDWQAIAGDEPVEAATTTSDRLRWILTGFGLAAAIIFARAVQLELADGATFRQLAAQPLERTIPLAAERGQILARDGTPLAIDAPARSLAISFRYLQSPPDPAWLKRVARARLPRGQRDAARVAAMQSIVREELAERDRRLARLCKLSDEQWKTRTSHIQRRVESMAARVAERRLAHYEQQAELDDDDSLSFTDVLSGLFAPPEPLPPPPVTLVEELAYHPVVGNVVAEVIAEIEKAPQAYPGVKIVDATARQYPQGALAGQIIGHIAPRRPLDPTPPMTAHDQDEPEGRMGIERQFESQLSGARGVATRLSDHRGGNTRTRRDREPVAGQNVVLTLDVRLQIAAEHLLDRACRRQSSQERDAPEPKRGGAIVVMDVRSGELFAAASSPRFDPAWFANDDERAELLLNDARRPLFDRVTKMALPPGSVFKPLTALAMLDQSGVDAQQTFRCQGFLEEPDRLRCQIFRQHGIGHGDVTLSGALAQSCNVYFFHHATQLGAVSLLEGATRFGFGQPTGIELADESPGRVPTSEELRPPDQTRMFSIGQGPFTATPLQVARFYAAIANGGFLITPRLVAGVDPTASRGTDEDAAWQASSGTRRIEGVGDAALATVREGLRRVVDDPQGTAYESVHVPWLSVAGKTGTAETGGASDHAWFAGYAPADRPRFVFVVALEHAGSGATQAGGVAKSLLEAMHSLGYFGTRTARAVPNKE